jgi:hypothetical protein
MITTRIPSSFRPLAILAGFPALASVTVQGPPSGHVIRTGDAFVFEAKADEGKADLDWVAVSSRGWAESSPGLVVAKGWTDPDRPQDPRIRILRLDARRAVFLPPTELDGPETVTVIAGYRAGTELMKGTTEAVLRPWADGAVPQGPTPSTFLAAVYGSLKAWCGDLRFLQDGRRILHVDLGSGERRAVQVEVPDLDPRGFDMAYERGTGPKATLKEAPEQPKAARTEHKGAPGPAGINTALQVELQAPEVPETQVHTLRLAHGTRAGCFGRLLVRVLPRPAAMSTERKASRVRVAPLVRSEQGDPLDFAGIVFTPNVLAATGHDDRPWLVAGRHKTGYGSALFLLDGKGVLTKWAGDPDKKLRFHGPVLDGRGSECIFPSFRALAPRPGARLGDGSFQVVILDQRTHHVRLGQEVNDGKDAPGLVVKTLAGTPDLRGASDGPVRQALFNEPAGAAMTSAGAVLVTDRNGLRMIKDSVVTTLVKAQPDAPPTAAPLLQPEALALDEANGILYVADTGCIRAVPLDGKSEVRVLVGMPGNPGYQDGGCDALRGKPSVGARIGSMALYQGRLFFLDAENHALRVVDLAGQFVRTLLSEGHDRALELPSCMALSPTGVGLLGSYQRLVQWVEEPVPVGPQGKVEESAGR